MAVIPKRKETPEERKAFREAINEVRSWKRQAFKERTGITPEQWYKERKEKMIQTTGREAK
jgi:methylphosphotriester-DNA--protein-cysteine methyltransferase